MGRLSSAGVLRLRAIKPSVCDRSAKRFAQDDGFVRSLKYSWLDMQKTQKRSKKSQAPSEAEGSAVSRTSAGNAEYQVASV